MDHDKNLFLPSLEELGKQVRLIRKKEKLSQKKLADLCECSHVAIIQLEKGTGKINISTAWRIMDTLGIIKL